jgi:hypothetical protein
MFKTLRAGVGVLSVLLLVGLAGTARAQTSWYQVTFTGADIWKYSADNSAGTRVGQDAPRRYRDWSGSGGGGEKANEVKATTYGVGDGGVFDGLTGGFNDWAPSSGFAFDSINLWGAGGTAAGAWGEKYISVGNSDPGAEGVSSWKVMESPATWTSGIVKGNDLWSADAFHAFPVWRSAGDADRLGLANKYDPAFRFTFQVLISNPLTAFEPDKKLRVFFGGYSDDQQMTGPQNYEVSGVMKLDATEIPEPSSLLLIGGILAGLGVMKLRKRS